MICVGSTVSLQGGAVSYAAVVAKALKAKSCVVTGVYS